MPRRKPRESLLSLGLSLVGLGRMLLLVPAMLGSHPIFAALQTGLRTPAWWAIGLGVVLGVLHLTTTVTLGNWGPGIGGNWGQIPIKNLCKGSNPMTRDDAVVREIEVGIDLRSAGVGVWQA